MRILLNASSTHMGGGMTYLRGLVPSLLRVDARNIVKLIAPAETIATLPIAENGRFVPVAYPFASSAGPGRLYFDQVRLPRELAQWGADVLISTTGFATLRSPVPQILLIPNALYFVDRPGHSLDPGHLARTLLTRLSIRAADHVVFPSAALLGEALKILPELAGKSEVLHHGFDRAEFASDAAVPAGMHRLEEARRCGSSIILTVSSYARHKNLETLVEALARLIARGLAVELVTTLSRSETGEKPAYDRLLRRIEALDLSDRVHHLGPQPRRNLPALYGAADVFVFPSLIESFGFPLVEAMAMGVPIVAAAIPASRELCEDAAVYFDALDGEDCASAIARVLGDADLRGRLGEGGLRRAESFSWEGYARKIMALAYQLTAAEPRSSGAL